jgi:hypothetical protein
MPKEHLIFLMADRTFLAYIQRWWVPVAKLMGITLFILVVLVQVSFGLSSFRKGATIDAQGPGSVPAPVSTGVLPHVHISQATPSTPPALTLEPARSTVRQAESRPIAPKAVRGCAEARPAHDGAAFIRVATFRSAADAESALTAIPLRRARAYCDRAESNDTTTIVLYVGPYFKADTLRRDVGSFKRMGFSAQTIDPAACIDCQ